MCEKKWRKGIKYLALGIKQRDLQVQLECAPILVGRLIEGVRGCSNLYPSFLTLLPFYEMPGYQTLTRKGQTHSSVIVKYMLCFRIFKGYTNLQFISLSVIHSSAALRRPKGRLIN